MTEISRDGVSDALYDEARTHFSERDLIDLTIAVIAINAWNRLAVTFGPTVGHHTPQGIPTPAVA